MEKNYSVEMAFDWDTAPKPGQTDRLLEHTLMHMDPGKGFGQAGSYAQLNVGQALLFRVCDNSEDTSVVGTVTDFELQIFEAHPPHRGVDPFLSVPTFPGRRPMNRGTSPIYGRDLPMTNIYGPNPFILAVEGRYKVTMTLTVQKGSETRIFSVDPEWIVGSG